MDYEVSAVRVAERLACPLWVVGEMPIADYLDEVDAAAYLADLEFAANQPPPGERS